MSIKRNSRLLVAISAAATLGLLATACSSEAPTSDEPVANEEVELTELRLAINNTSSSLPAIIADQMGFFEEEGIDAELQTMNDITQIPPTLGKQFDIGYGVQPILINATSQGVPITMVAANDNSTEDNPVLLVIASEESGIQGPEDMAGKVLGAPTLVGNLHTAALNWIQDAGVNVDDVQSLQVQSPAMIDQLNAGLIDAAEMQQPFINMAKDEGMVEAGYPLGLLGDTVYMSSWQADRTWAEENSELINNFKAALDKAIAWIEDPANTSEAHEITAAHTGLDLEVVEIMQLSNFSTEVVPEAVEQWENVMRDINGFSGEIDYDTIIFTGE